MSTTGGTSTDRATNHSITATPRNERSSRPASGNGYGACGGRSDMAATSRQGSSSNVTGSGCSTLIKNSSTTASPIQRKLPSMRRPSNITDDPETTSRRSSPNDRQRIRQLDRHVLRASSAPQHRATTTSRDYQASLPDPVTAAGRRRSAGAFRQVGLRWPGTPRDSPSPALAPGTDRRRRRRSLGRREPATRRTPHYRHR